MSKKILLSFLGLMLCMAANAAYQTTWPIYGEVVVEDYFLADDNSTITSQGDAYYWYQYSPLLQVAALRAIYPSNASGERDFVLVPTYIIVDGLAYHVVGVSGTLLGNDANNIKNIYLHNELEFLGSRALYNAIAVSSITIPASVKSISHDILRYLQRHVLRRGHTHSHLCRQQRAAHHRRCLFQRKHDHRQSAVTHPAPGSHLRRKLLWHDRWQHLAADPCQPYRGRPGHRGEPRHVQGVQKPH